MLNSSRVRFTLLHTKNVMVTTQRSYIVEAFKYNARQYFEVSIPDNMVNSKLSRFSDINRLGSCLSLSAADGLRIFVFTHI